MFLTSLNYIVYLNYSHQHTHFHQHFGLFCGLADCLFYYSLVIHSNGLHFPSCQALLDSVIWYGTLSRACFRWLSGKLSDAHSLCCCFPGFWRPALPPSLIIKTWYAFEVSGLGCSFYFPTPKFQICVYLCPFAFAVGDSLFFIC